MEVGARVDTCWDSLGGLNRKRLRVERLGLGSNIGAFWSLGAQAQWSRGPGSAPLSVYLPFEEVSSDLFQKPVQVPAGPETQGPCLGLNPRLRDGLRAQESDFGPARAELD